MQELAIDQHSAHSAASTTQSRSPTPPPPSHLSALLRAALHLPHTHVWLSDFLLSTTPIETLIAPCGIQTASAAVLNISLPPLLGTHLLIPIFSRANVTLGLLLSITPAHSPPLAARCVLDNESASLLAVRDSTLLHLCYTSVGARRLARIQLHPDTLCDLLRRPSTISANAVHDAVITTELDVCDARNGPLDTGLPSHPLDFSVFARNLALYHGRMHAEVGMANGCGRGVTGEIRVGVDEGLVTAWCRRAADEAQKVGCVEEKSDDERESATEGGGWYGRTEGDNVESLRKMRNREAAARSNLRRKERLEWLRDELQTSAITARSLRLRERQLKEENTYLKAAANAS